MKKNQIKAILVITVLVILFVLSSFALYYIDNLVIQLISWIYIIIFSCFIIAKIIVIIITLIDKLSDYIEDNLL